MVRNFTNEMIGFVGNIYTAQRLVNNYIYISVCGHKHEQCEVCSFHVIQERVVSHESSGLVSKGFAD